MRGMKSIHFAVRLPEALAGALEKHFQRRAIPDFIRRATAEKLARDFGEKIDSDGLKMRIGQGRRTDLLAAREALRAAREREEASFSAAKTDAELFAKIGRATRAGMAEIRLFVEEARIRARREPKIRDALKAWEAESAREPRNVPALEKAWIALCIELKAD